MSRVATIVGGLVITAISMPFIENQLKARDRAAEKCGYITGHSAAEIETVWALNNALDTESNQFAIRSTLKNEDTFIRLSSLIENAEPPIVRPTIWEVMANYLLHRSPEESIEVTIDGVLKRFKLPELKPRLK